MLLILHTLKIETLQVPQMFLLYGKKQGQLIEIDLIKIFLPQ